MLKRKTSISCLMIISPPLYFFLVFLTIGISNAATLDAPMEKKSTLRSEIIRGVQSINPNFNFIDIVEPRKIIMAEYLLDLESPIKLNIQASNVTPGYFLGAYYSSWVDLTVLLKVIGKKLSNQEYEMAEGDAKRYFKKFREIQKNYKITDRELFDLIEVKYEKMKPLIDEWNKK